MNPKVAELFAAAVLFPLVFFAMTRLLARINRVLAERADATEIPERRASLSRREADQVRALTESTLAEARHEAARIRQRAFEEGAALIAEARADGQREQDAILAQGHARLQSDCAAAEAELRVYVSELASNLASKVVGERIEAGAESRP